MKGTFVSPPRSSVTAAPTLRRSMLGLGGVLVSVALVAAVALVVITTALNRETRGVAAMDARLRASLQTKVGLLTYARASDRAVSEGSAVAATGRTEAESALRSALHDTRRLAVPASVTVRDSLIRKGEDYIATRKRLEAEGLPLTVPSGARELRDMAATFNELADRLARQEADRLTFLGGIAHDLRNPLSALKMATDVVRLGKQPTSRERLERTLAIVARQIGRLDRMVGDLLDSTRIESGRLELRREPLDVRPVIGQVVELYRPVAPAHELVFVEPKEAVIADFDPTRIEQVITNLVSNAVKYSPHGGRVTVTAFAERSEAIVEVTDEGMGIPPEERDQIFEPFRRTRRSRELLPGVGLGLSVARKIVAGHGGSLEVESHVGAGSTFRVRLPLVSAGSGAPPDGPA